MNQKLYKFLKFLHIVDSCPNCDSAWTGGCPNPEDRTTCIVCGDKESKITGWVWGKVVDPFCWLGQHNVARNLKLKNVLANENK
ncbi:MAG: hypothetical protein M0R80_25675 [Proteobacteria bacterium]|jgi:hypothetical protein|nr:hypothetical protein [Pseudomonadota bacterium]